MAKLIIDDTENTTEYTLEGHRTTIGREVSNDIVLAPSYVSRFHSEIDFDGTKYTITDLNSSNGTLVNGKVMDRQQLADGDRVQIGAIVMTFLEGPKMAPVPPPPSPMEEAEENNIDGTRMLSTSAAKEQISETAEAIPAPGKSPVVEPAPRKAPVAPPPLPLQEQESLIERARKRLLDVMDISPAATVEADAERRHKAMEVLREFLEENKDAVPVGEKKGNVARDLLAKILPLGPLDDLLEDQNISTVYVNSPDQVYTSSGGKVTRRNTSFESEEQVMAILERLANSSGRRIYKDKPMAYFHRKDGLKVQAILPPFTPHGPSLVIKKSPPHLYTLETLVEKEAITPEVAQFLEGCVSEKRNLVITGDVTTGKTTLLKSLCAQIPLKERVVVLEELGELSLEHPNCVTVELSPADPTVREGAFSAEAAVCGAMRLQPDRMIIGELTPQVVPALFAAVSPGIKGLMSTCYATSPQHFLFRVEGLLAMGMGVPRGPELPRLVDSAIDVVVDLRVSAKRLPMVDSIYQVSGVEEDRVQLKKVFGEKPI